MTDARGQGRPRRSDGEVGRDRLLEMACAAMSARPRTDIQRQEIAKAAGVTPALVSYYYPDKWQLLESAARPVIEDYVAQIRFLLNSQDDPVETLKKLTLFYINFNRRHGFVLEYYLEAVARREARADATLLNEAYAEILAFFDANIRAKRLRDCDAALLQSTLWGVCKYIANLSDPQQAHPLSIDGDPEAGRRQADLVCDLLLNGILMPPSAAP